MLAGDLIDLGAGLPGAVGVVNLDPVAVGQGALGRCRQLLGAGVEQGHQIAPLLYLHIFIAGDDGAGDPGDLIPVDHIQGVITICNIIGAQFPQVIRQVDQAEIAVNVAVAVGGSDPEHPVGLLQHAVSGGSGGRADHFLALGVPVNFQVLDRPNGGKLHRQSGGQFQLLGLGQEADGSGGAFRVPHHPQAVMGARAQFDLAGGFLRRVHLHKVAPFGDVIGAVLHPIAITFGLVPLEGVGVFPFLHRPQLDLSS